MSKIEIDEIFEKLFQYFHVSTISELAEKLLMSQPSVSNWRTRNSISAIKKRCRELGIYNEIFGDINTNTQYIHSNSGNNTQSGDIHSTTAQKKVDDDEIDPAVFEVFKRAYKKANIDEDKLDDFITYLLQFK